MGSGSILLLLYLALVVTGQGLVIALGFPLQAFGPYAASIVMVVLFFSVLIMAWPSACWLQDRFAPGTLPA
jgi:hypothetical protein